MTHPATGRFLPRGEKTEMAMAAVEQEIISEKMLKAGAGLKSRSLSRDLCCG